jgi:hypothetical protein
MKTGIPEQFDGIPRSTLRFRLVPNTGETNHYHPPWGHEAFAGEQFLNDDGWHLNWMDLTRSALQPGDYFIITCSCGEAACARLNDPVQVIHADDMIGWHIVEPKPERRFLFDREQYRCALLEFLREVRRVVPDSTEGIEYDFGYYGFLHEDVDWCIKTLETGIIDES